MQEKQKHIPVLLDEVINSLNLADGKVLVDGTLGLGGYSEKALSSFKDIKIVAFDLDQENLNLAKERLYKYHQQITFVHDNFANLKENLEDLGIEKIDALMLDLGIASTQVDIAEKGFSFNKEGDLDMRFDKNQHLTAKDIVNNYDLNALVRIFREFGEERSAFKIAKEIVDRRKIQKFENTKDLAELIEKVKGVRKGKIHPATQVFQALRIAVNQELDNLQKILEDSVDFLGSKARVAVVSYHSLEDKIVKDFYRENSREFVNLPNELTTTYLTPKFRIITKKPISPGKDEVNFNPRARSAKLRVVEKI